MGKNSPSLPEVAAFLEAAQSAGPREHALACLLALNGLPMHAVCRARVSDLVDDHGQRAWVSVSLTGGRPTPIPLDPRTARAIEEYLDGRCEGPLLLSEDETRPLDQREASTVVRRIVRAAGLAYRLDEA